MIRCGRRFESLPSRYLTCREGQGAVRQVGVGKDVDLGAADAFSAPYAAILLQIGASPASHSSAAYGALDWPRRFRPAWAGNRHVCLRYPAARAYAVKCMHEIPFRAESDRGTYACGGRQSGTYMATLRPEILTTAAMQ